MMSKKGLELLMYGLKGTAQELKVEAQTIKDQEPLVQEAFKSMDLYFRKVLQVVTCQKYDLLEDVYYDFVQSLEFYSSLVDTNQEGSK